MVIIEKNILLLFFMFWDILSVFKHFFFFMENDPSLTPPSLLEFSIHFCFGAFPYLGKFHFLKPSLFQILPLYGRICHLHRDPLRASALSEMNFVSFHRTECGLTKFLG